MMRRLPLLVAISILTACSEAPLEDQSEEAAAEIEKQIQGDAKSLEEAADEAVRVLESEIEEELTADGFARPVPTSPRVSDDQEQ